MNYCLSIGIDKYLKLSNTPYAENDAKEFNNIVTNIVEITNAILLLGHQATYKNIEFEINNICSKMDETDQLFFFFAGHGINIKGSPYLSTYDSQKLYMEDTWYSVIELIEKVNNTGCKKNIYFIDACESTIQLGSRDSSTAKFMLEEIKEGQKDNSYTCVFSSCSHKGVADIYPDKKHGIWTYYLLKALSGEDEKALALNRCLTYDSLKNYLNIKVKEYCKVNKDCAIQQTYTWGKSEGDFIIFEFPELKVQTYNTIPPQKLKQIEFVTFHLEEIKQLSGFRKGLHSVPKYISSTTEKFINKIASEDIREHMENVSISLRKLMNLKRKDYKCNIEGNTGYFV